MAEKIRVDKLLSNMGMGSRKDIKDAVKKGLVSVNGEKIKDSGLAVSPESDTIALNGKKVVYEQFLYIMMNKPSGYVSANEDKRDKTVMDLLEAPLKQRKLFVAGRLDKDTEGLLILTNNGAFAHNMLSPAKHVAKTYYAKIDGCVTQDDISAFHDGITIDGDYKCKSAQLNIIKSGAQSEIELTIYEGRFHQVKKMFEALDKQVVYLKRIRIGGLKLDSSLISGGCKKLSDEEVAMIGAALT